ncbi:MAG: hypothetical protein ACKVT1_07125 [Dehalococcoidia bacterium]
MAFTVSDFDDLVDLLASHPEWRARLRPVILGPDFEEVPSRLDRIEAILHELAERQSGVEQRLDHIDSILQTLAERQAVVERRMDRLDGRMGNTEGRELESRYSRNLDNWLGDFLRQPRRVSLPDLDLLSAALASGVVTAGERRRLRDADMIVAGTDLSGAEGEVYLAAEFSYTVNMEDLARAEEHAEVLRRCGYNARGLIGGYRAGPSVEAAAQRLGVILDLHRPPD